MSFFKGKCKHFCYVKDCASNQRSREGIEDMSFFRLPANPVLRELWLSLCQIEVLNRKDIRVCELHFSSEDWKQHENIINGQERKRKLLKRHILPSLNLPPSNEDTPFNDALKAFRNASTKYEQTEKTKLMLKKLMKRKARRPYCSVKNCTRDQWNKVGIHNKTFYRLPSAPFYKERWLDVCQIDPNDTRVVKVCDRHFTVHDLKLNKTTDGKDRTRMLLKHFAIPSLNLPPPPLNLEDISVPDAIKTIQDPDTPYVPIQIIQSQDEEIMETSLNGEVVFSENCNGRTVYVCDNEDGVFRKYRYVLDNSQDSSENDESGENFEQLEVSETEIDLDAVNEDIESNALIEKITEEELNHTKTCSEIEKDIVDISTADVKIIDIAADIITGEN